jgi:hypothetical protein
MRTPHTSCRKGKRVIVTLRDGSRHIDKFVERIGKGVVLENLGLIKVKQLRAFTIYRGQTA